MADVDSLVRAADPAFRDDVLAGLAASVPAIPARWFYDHRGSELFEEITRLPEYIRPAPRPACWSGTAARSQPASAPARQ